METRTREGSATYHIDSVLCQDGKRRKLKRLGTPDTYFSIPAAITVNGKTVTGFVTSDDGTYCFTANKFGKNAYLLREV